MGEASSKEFGDARIVQHSSLARNAATNGLEQPYFSKQEKDGMLGGDDDSKFMGGPEWTRYAQTKLANSVFCQALHTKLSSSTDESRKNILSLCAHPGFSATNLSSHLKPSFLMKIMMIPVGLFLVQSAEDGAMGLLKGMMDKRENVQSGVLYGPAGSGLKGNAVAIPSKPHETDSKSQSLLWTKSEEAIGASFSL